MASHPKRPRDPNQLAKFVVDVATGQRQDEAPIKPTRAAEQGRLGGLLGGPARAAMLSVRKRKAIAKMGAQARWSRKRA
jgi:ribosomal protein L10